MKVVRSCLRNTIHNRRQRVIAEKTVWGYSSCDAKEGA